MDISDGHHLQKKLVKIPPEKVVTRARNLCEAEGLITCAKWKGPSNSTTSERAGRKQSKLYPLASSTACLFLENATVRGRDWYKLLDASVLTLDVTV